MFYTLHPLTQSNMAELKRVIGISGLAVSVVNFTIGAGIFVLPALVGIKLGSYSLLAYMFCAIMLASIMLCYAEIGSRITTTGGSYAYVEQVFGPLAGFIVNGLFFFGWGVLGSAALMNILVDSLGSLFPVFNMPWIRGIMIFFILGGFAFINFIGVRQSINFVKLITLIKLIPLLFIILLGFGPIQMDHLSFHQVPSLKDFGEAILILFFAYAGFETSLSLSGEFKNPERTIPRGLLYGGVVILIIYLLLQTIVQGVLGEQLALYKEAPLAAVADSILGSAGASILLLAAAISCFGSVSGDVMATPRVLYAASKDHLLPEFLSKLHPKFGTPHSAVISYAALIFVFSVSGGFKQLAVMASCAILLIYAAVVLAMIKYKRNVPLTSDQVFKLPGGYSIPIIALLCIFWLLAHLSMNEFFITFVFILFLIAFYYVKVSMGKIKK